MIMIPSVTFRMFWKRTLGVILMILAPGLVEALRRHQKHRKQAMDFKQMQSLVQCSHVQQQCKSLHLL